MKKFLLLICLCISFGLKSQIQTPASSPSCKLEQKLGLGTVTLEYSRPSVKSRTIFGDLVPFDKLWRTGANKSTVITFSEDVTVEGKPISKGSYSLFTIPGEKSWQFIFYNEINISGTPEKYDLTKVVATVDAVPELLTTVIETFTIDINDIKINSGKLVIMWENTMVSVNISTKVDEVVTKNIEKVLAGPTSDDYYQAAKYYYDTGKDLNVALPWIQKATVMDAKFWKLRVESLILGKLGKLSEAIAAAEKSKLLASAAGNDDYVKMNTEAIEEWTRAK
ncbi:MAG: DUF2911 domain-containing protein [Saprospiraceae bacterium]